MGGLYHGQLHRRDGSVEVPRTGPLAGDPCASLVGLAPQPRPSPCPNAAAADADAGAAFADPAPHGPPTTTTTTTTPAPVFVGSTVGAEGSGGLLAPGSLGSLSLVPPHMVQQLPSQHTSRLGNTSGLARRAVRQVGTDACTAGAGAHPVSGLGLLHRRQGGVGSARGSIAALQEHQHQLRVARMGGVGAWGGAGAAPKGPMAGHSHLHAAGGAAGVSSRAGWRAGLPPLSLGAIQHDETDLPSLQWQAVCQGGLGPSTACPKYLDYVGRMYGMPGRATLYL
eukprot:scaffold253437_cov22-Tisochrysis_lutea.AAC.1